jgi:DNA invertase Pin-like site-specific DNA recombinase
MYRDETKAVGYVRVSTLLNQNPQNQITSLEQFAKARGFDLTKIYIDEGVSGAKERRPALDEMIADARRGKFKVLMVTGIDRLARDTRHLLNMINELSHYSVALVSLRENLDFTTPVGHATLTILGAVSTLERELIRERIKSALAAKKILAAKTGNGWRCGRKPVITEPVTKKVLELRAAGVSIRNIAKQVGIAKSTVQRIIKDSVPTKVPKVGGASD